MLFNSFAFLIFFPISVIFYFAFKGNSRLAWLLIFSSVFYMFGIPQYILILYFIILVDYAAAIYIEKSTPGPKRFYFLCISLAINLGTLIYFKYANFFLSSLHLNSLLYQVVLPIGLSFHTFQSIAYVIEVYRGRAPAERNILVYANYVLFFPQLVAGPIERPNNLIHQFKKDHSLTQKNILIGCLWMARGFMKKMLIADPLSYFVDKIYSDPHSYQSGTLMLATYFFAIQIYCDFSGYSDIAFGTARILGIRFSKNFLKPYNSRDISEFWRRWHISLSSWFRDYVYIPLGGSRRGFVRVIINTMIVFLVSGLWHGANWTFIAWGAVHGLYIAIYLMMKRFGMPTLPKFLAVFITFNAVSFAWIFFRAKDMNSAWFIIEKIFLNYSWTWHEAMEIIAESKMSFVWPLLTLIVIRYIFALSKDIFSREYFSNSSLVKLSMNALSLLLGIDFLYRYILFTATNSQMMSSMKFIYFQF